jgi:hypothetical protein
VIWRFPFCHRGTTKSSHPFFIGMFHEINHPASSQCSRYLGSPKGSALRFHLPSPVRRRGREHRPWSLPRSSPSSQGHPGRRLEEFFWEHLEDSLVSTRDWWYDYGIYWDLMGQNGMFFWINPISLTTIWDWELMGWDHNLDIVWELG